MDLKFSYAEVKKRIREACLACGRDPASVKLIAASKGQSMERILELHSLGQVDFGENYAQELVEKAAKAPSSIRWSYIGRLQSRKIKSILSVASEIQSVDSWKQIEMIARLAQASGKAPYPIFLEAHVEGDANKGGFGLAELRELASRISRDYAGVLDLQGVMAIPPLAFAEHWSAEAERVYRDLRSLANGVGAGKLSLGMSSDLEQAIRCGTDIVRVGTALMGGR